LQSAILITVTAVACILLAGWLYQRWGAARDERRYPAPGVLFDMGGHRLHFLAEGESGPAVVFESGLMSTVLSWKGIQPEVAKFARTVCYDRAGLGWSEPGPLPRDAEQIAVELRTLLQRANVPPPYILVGHSFAGLTTRVFAARYPDEIVGLVLIDPVVPSEWHPASEHNQQRIRTGARILRRAAALCRVGALRFVSLLLLAGIKPIADPLVRLMSKGAPKGDGTTRSPLFWNLPAAERSMAPVFWVLPKFTNTIASQLENLPRSAAQVAASGKLRDIPVTVISAANTPPGRQVEQAAFAQSFPMGKHMMANRSGHWIMEDEPELVLQAISDVVEQLREPRLTGEAV
jgi:pimeloyl-ACP methyl ester carboxylesterase